MNSNEISLFQTAGSTNYMFKHRRKQPSKGNMSKIREKNTKCKKFIYNITLVSNTQ